MEEEKSFTIQKSTLYGFGIFLLVIAGGFFMLQGGSSQGVTGNAVFAGGGNGAVQEVVLGMKNYNYYPNTVNVKAGSPVKLSLDDSAYGCFRDFTIKDLGVRKYLRSASDFVEFTPTNPGTYTFACSMGMGFGKLVVS